MLLRAPASLVNAPVALIKMSHCLQLSGACCLGALRYMGDLKIRVSIRGMTSLYLWEAPAEARTSSLHVSL